jgi:uncharacterized protein YbjT (DUF2867 family)
VLLISSSDLGNRVAQHRNAIDAAARAKVSLLAYTSVLHADRSTLGLAANTARPKRRCALGRAVHLLRNGWYVETTPAAWAARWRMARWLAARARAASRRRRVPIMRKRRQWC